MIKSQMLACILAAIPASESPCNTNVCQSVQDFADFLDLCTADEAERILCCEEKIQALNVTALNQFHYSDPGQWHFARVFDGNLNNCGNTKLNLTGWNDEPFDGVTFRNMFREFPSDIVGLENWNVGNVVSFRAMFRDFPNDIVGLGNWNVGNVENMARMFMNAINFNGDLSGWNVKSVTNMDEMFYNASNFDQNLACWDVRTLEDASNMFKEATRFESDLTGWNLENIKQSDSWLEGSAMEYNQACHPGATSGTCNLDPCPHTETTMPKESASPTTENSLSNGEIAGIAAGSIVGTGIIVSGVLYAPQILNSAQTISVQSLL